MRFIILILSMFCLADAQLSSGLRSYGGSNRDYLEKINFNPQNNMIFFTFALSNSYKIDNSNGSDFLIISVTPFGSSIWERVIGVSNLNDWAYEIDFDANNNILVGGITCTPDGSIEWCSHLPSSINEGFVIKVNSNDGSIIRAIRIRDLFGNPSINNHLRILSVKSTTDGGFVIGGEIQYEKQVCNNNNCYWANTTQGIIAKFDSNMVLQWSRVVGDTTSSSVFDYRGIVSVMQTGDNNILAVSTARNGIWVGKFNVNNGSVIWQKFYNRTRNSSVSKLSWAKLTSNGNIIIADHIDNSGQHSDVLFVKLDANGNFSCARRFGTYSNDVGIDVAYGINNYYITGFWYNGGSAGYLFYAKLDLNCNLLSVRYLEGIDAEGRGITVKGNIPYVVGWSNYQVWSNGDYDGILAADSGIQDTCYWRTAIPDINQSVSLSQGNVWSVYNANLQIINATYNSLPVNVAKKVRCGSLTPVNNDENNYEDCDIKIYSKKGYLEIISNNLNFIKIYDITGRQVYSSKLKGKEKIYLKKGIYVVSFNGKMRKFIIN
ncbi:MAG: T9SS type A sorting domain-containing protein [candidate division WOR-3 bacterium]